MNRWECNTAETKDIIIHCIDWLQTPIKSFVSFFIFSCIHSVNAAPFRLFHEAQYLSPCQSPLLSPESLISLSALRMWQVAQSQKRLATSLSAEIEPFSLPSCHLATYNHTIKAWLLAFVCWLQVSHSNLLMTQKCTAFIMFLYEHFHRPCAISHQIHGSWFNHANKHKRGMCFKTELHHSSICMGRKEAKVAFFSFSTSKIALILPPTRNGCYLNLLKNQECSCRVWWTSCRRGSRSWLPLFMSRLGLM